MIEMQNPHQDQRQNENHVKNIYNIKFHIHKILPKLYISELVLPNMNWIIAILGNHKLHLFQQIFGVLSLYWLAQSEPNIRTELRPDQTRPDQTRPDPTGAY